MRFLYNTKSAIVLFLDLIISLFLPRANFLVKIVIRKSKIITATMHCTNVMAPSKLKCDCLSKNLTCSHTN